MGIRRSPGGFPIAFYERLWDITRKVFLSGSSTQGVSFLKLLVRPSLPSFPRSLGANKVKDYRPFSLISSIYKILAKVLAGRLQNVMPSIISQSQGAFINGRQVLDRVLIAK